MRSIDDRQRLAVALALVLAYMCAEVAVALVAHSVVLLSDAGHMLADAGALAGVMWASRLAERPSTPIWSFGLKRAEILSAAANGVALVVVGALVLVEAIVRLVHPVATEGVPMLVVAGAGVVVNVAATWVLSGADHHSLNFHSAFLHVLTDLYAILATAAAAIVILLTRSHLADPIASLVVVALVLQASWKLLRASGHILLEGTPEAVDLAEVRRHIAELPEVIAVHDLHAWTLTSDLPALTAHVVVSDECLGRAAGSELLDRLQDCLSAHFDVEHSTFQLEAATHVEHEAHTHD